MPSWTASLISLPARYKKTKIVLAGVLCTLAMWCILPWLTIERNYYFGNLCGCGGWLTLKDGHMYVQDWHGATKGAHVGTYTTLSHDRYRFDFAYKENGKQKHFSTVCHYDGHGFLDSEGYFLDWGMSNRYMGMHAGPYNILSAFIGWRPHHDWSTLAH